MFVVEFLRPVIGTSRLTAKAARFESLAGLVGEFYELAGQERNPLWAEDNGRYYTEFYDWYECWFEGATPIARVFAPAGYQPPR